MRGEPKGLWRKNLPSVESFLRAWAHTDPQVEIDPAVSSSGDGLGRLDQSNAHFAVEQKLLDPVELGEVAGVRDNLRNS